MTATLFGPFIRKKLGSFPILHVFATTGSGKTSLFNRVLWPAFTGVRTGELLSCTSSASAFARDFSSANALALILDEFNESDMGPKAVENLYRSVRRIYSGDTETRGRPDAASPSSTPSNRPGSERSGAACLWWLCAPWTGNRPASARSHPHPVTSLTA